jgi:hypothetical protein
MKKNKPKTVRITMTIPNDLNADLIKLTQMLRVSRSSLITEILNEQVRSIISLTSMIPQAEPDNADPKKRNYELVRSYLDSFRNVIETRTAEFDQEKDELLGLIQPRDERNEH